MQLLEGGIEYGTSSKEHRWWASTPFCICRGWLSAYGLAPGTIKSPSSCAVSDDVGILALHRTWSLVFYMALHRTWSLVFYMALHRTRFVVFYINSVSDIPSHNLVSFLFFYLCLIHFLSWTLGNIMWCFPLSSKLFCEYINCLWQLFATVRANDSLQGFFSLSVQLQSIPLILVDTLSPSLR